MLWTVLRRIIGTFILQGIEKAGLVLFLALLLIRPASLDGLPDPLYIGWCQIRLGALGWTLDSDCF